MTRRIEAAAASALAIVSVPAAAQTAPVVPSPRVQAPAAPPAPAQPAGKPFVSPLFTDHAVLQRDQPLTVWGWAPSRTGIVVSFEGSSQKTRADKSGRWKVTLPAHAAGGPYTLYVTGSNGTDLAVSDLMVGDVWLCSGQSNMEFPLRHVTNADATVAAATDKAVRLFTVPRAASDLPAEQLAKPSAWQLTSPDTARDFSAACFFMGREIAKDQNVTVGLIHASWGGSAAEAWIPAGGLKDVGGFDDALGALRLHAKSPERAEEAFRLQMDSWWTARAGDNEPGGFDFDDSAWPLTDGTKPWEEWGIDALKRFDGIMWYRTAIELTPEQAEGAAVLTMGAVDDLDETVVNGERVGGMRGWNAVRSYRVRAGLLRPGRNVIAVRVLDAGGSGGLYGDPAARVLTFADGTQLPVSGPWRWQQGPTLRQIGDPPPTPWGDTAGLTTLYNGMIAPVEQYALRGVAWYQGEANVGNPGAYAKLLPALVRSWRDRLEFKPFVIVQLAGYGPRATEPTDPGVAHIRDIQRQVAAADRAAALASAIDIGDPGDIHPTEKLELGRRLGFAARAAAYGEQVAGSGPVPLNASQSGNLVTVRFASTLKLFGGAQAIGFELCDVGNRCRFAGATVQGVQVVIPSDGPVAKVRYLWAESPIANLYDVNDLPVPGFELPVAAAVPAAAAVGGTPGSGEPAPAAVSASADPSPAS